MKFARSKFGVVIALCGRLHQGIRTTVAAPASRTAGPMRSARQTPVSDPALSAPLSARTPTDPVPHPPLDDFPRPLLRAGSPAQHHVHVWGREYPPEDGAGAHGGGERDRGAVCRRSGCGGVQ